MNFVSTNLTFSTFSFNAKKDANKLAELFRPGRQKLDNYDLKLAHRRANVALDMYLGENNVQAGIDCFANIINEGPMESLSWAACHVIRAGLTLDKVSSNLFKSTCYREMVFSHLSFQILVIMTFFILLNHKQKPKFSISGLSKIILPIIYH